MKALVVTFIAVCFLASILCLEADKPVQKLLSLSKREAGLEHPGDVAVSREKRHECPRRCNVLVPNCLVVGRRRRISFWRRRRRRFWRRRRIRRTYLYRAPCYQRKECPKKN